jgi:hypothetical protein
VRAAGLLGDALEPSFDFLTHVRAKHLEEFVLLLGDFRGDFQRLDEHTRNGRTDAADHQPEVADVGPHLVESLRDFL